MHDKWTIQLSRVDCNNIIPGYIRDSRCSMLHIGTLGRGVGCGWRTEIQKLNSFHVQFHYSHIDLHQYDYIHINENKIAADINIHRHKYNSS